MRFMTYVAVVFFWITNSFAELADSKLVDDMDDFFNQEDIRNQSTDYPNLGILSDIGVGVRLYQIRQNAIKRLARIVDLELATQISASDKTTRALVVKSEIIEKLELKLLVAGNDPLDLERQLKKAYVDKQQLAHELAVQTEQIKFNTQKLIKGHMKFKHERNLKRGPDKIILKKLAVLGLVLTIVDLTGQFWTDFHSPGEADHILGSGAWEYFEYGVEQAFGKMESILSEE